MAKCCRRISLVLAVWFLLAAACAQAAPAVVQKVRFSQTPDRVRLVFDMSAAVEPNVVLEQEPLRLLVELPATLGKGISPQVAFNDPFVASLQLQEVEPGRVRAAVNLKQAVNHKVFKLESPTRLVVDLFKAFDQKSERQIKPGLKYISWQRTQSGGPVAAHILQVDPKAGFVLKPVLSNGAVQGLETLTAISAGARALAAVNGSYFAPNGEIIGLLKIDGEIISTPETPRTAVGIFADGHIAFDQVTWQGNVELPGGRVALSAVNRERGENELILYTGYFGASTGTNTAGTEVVVAADGRVVAVSRGNTPIKAGTVVLSGHGEAAKTLAGLKTGDIVSIFQTLGPTWDQAVSALGAGPMLVKDGSVFLTTKVEEFGSDVAGGRAPRTALGITKEGNLLLVVVDGRQATSGGLTLLELALFMQELGAVDAMNLDGGGSSELVVNDKVMNKPSDGRERKVGDALVIAPAKLAN